MERQMEIIDLTDLQKDQILERVREILEESYIEKFTLVLKRQVHQSKTEKKLEKKESAIKKIKHKNSGSTNGFNFLFEKDTNTLDTHKLRVIGDSAAISKSNASTRGLEKKFSRISSVKSRDALSRMNESFLNTGIKVSQVPKSLQLYYEGQYQLALMQFFNQQKQLKRKLTQLNDKQKLQPQSREQLQLQYAKVMINIGNCYFCEKDYEKAIKFYSKMESEGSNNVDQKLIGQKYNNLGSCYAHKKQYQQSLKCFNEALKIYAKYPQLDSSNLMKNIGAIYFRSGMYSNAETYFQQSINERKAKSPENQEALLSTYYKLGLCQKYTHKFEQATNNLLFALNISEKGYLLNDEILKELAQTYEFQERFSEALLYYEKLSDEYERKQLSQGEIYEKVAKIHQKQKNFNDHDRFMKLALSQYRKFNNEGKLSEFASLKG